MRHCGSKPARYSYGVLSVSNKPVLTANRPVVRAGLDKNGVHRTTVRSVKLNAEKYKEIQRNVEKCRYAEISMIYDLHGTLECHI